MKAYKVMHIRFKNAYRRNMTAMYVAAKGECYSIASFMQIINVYFNYID